MTDEIKYIKRLESYIMRLESAYLDMWKVDLKDKEGNLTPDQLKELNQMANNMLQLQAQATLNKIREG